jgi:hypothetical protein
VLQLKRGTRKFNALLSRLQYIKKEEEGKDDESESQNILFSSDSPFSTFKQSFHDKQSTIKRFSGENSHPRLL